MLLYLVTIEQRRLSAPVFLLRYDVGEFSLFVETRNAFSGYFGQFNDKQIRSASDECRVGKHLLRALS